MAMDRRKQRILEAIVALYAADGEPVGSGLLANYFDMAVSSATLRNEMAALTRLGLLEQPEVVPFRGLPAVFYRYQAGETVYTVFCVENSGFYVEPPLSHAAGTGADAAYARLLETAYTLDLAL